MPYVLVRHKVQDFAKWKPIFDADAAVRTGAGLRDHLVLRNADDPTEVVAVFETDDIAAARDFAVRPELREVMEKAGVVGRPDMVFLEDAR